MKILMTADNLGGVWQYALALSEALARFEVEVALAVMGGPLSEAQREAAQKIPNLAVFESDYKLCWMEEPWEDVKAAGFWLLELASQVKPSLVHLNDYGHGALPWPAPVLMVGHSCVLSWWEAVREEPPPARWNRYRREVTCALQAADRVVAPSGAMLSALNRFYGPLPRRWVIFNGGKPKEGKGSEKKPLVLAAGRLWDEAKNFAVLAEVAPRLGWPVYIAGENRHPNGGRSSFHNVRLLGSLSSDSLAEWFARASIYALPARYEPFGLSALEAALAGCALVLGDIPSLREIWQDAACFVAPTDGQALQSALQTLIQDEQLRARYAQAAQARAVAFTLERMADAYWEVYRQLALESSRRA